MSYIPVQKISSKEAGRIRLVLLGFLLFNLLTVLFPYQNFIRYLLQDTGFFTHENSACFFLNAFDMPCAFCGMSRSLKELTHFDIAGSIYYNPTAFILYPAAALTFGSIFALSFMNYKLKINYNRTFWFTLLGAFLLVWILNILFGHQ